MVFVIAVPAGGERGKLPPKSQNFGKNKFFVYRKCTLNAKKSIRIKVKTGFHINLFLERKSRNHEQIRKIFHIRKVLKKSKFGQNWIALPPIFFCWYGYSFYNNVKRNITITPESIFF